MAGISVERIYPEEYAPHAVQVFENEDGSYSGFCFALGVYVPDPYKDKPKGYVPQKIGKTREEIDAEIKEIVGYKTVALPDRKLKQYALEYYGIKIGLSEEDGVTPRLHYYPYYKGGELSAYKVRLIEGKRMWSLGDMTDVHLFGWEQAKVADGKTLYITEGEVDCVSLYQILKDANSKTQYADRNPPIVSLPNGVSSASKVLTKLLPEIRRHFEKVVLVFDMDEPGRKAVQEVIKIIPDALVAELPRKDVNECLVGGLSKAAMNAVLFKAEQPKNTRLVSASSVVSKAREQVPMGFSYPYPKLTDLTRGRRFGETYYFGAG